MAEKQQGKPADVGTVARDGDRLVVRFPPGVEMPEDEVTVGRDGHRLILEWPQKTLVDLLEGMKPLSDENGFPDVDEGLPPVRDVDI